MDIQHTEEGSKGTFYIEKNGKQLAEMTYSRAGDDLLIIDHTQVDDELRGKGIGQDLVHAAVSYARSHHFKILPLCPFAKSVFKKEKDLQDVLK